jgi:hypothetical protein
MDGGNSTKNNYKLLNSWQTFVVSAINNSAQRIQGEFIYENNTTSRC